MALPPDLDRLGEQLASAAATTLARRGRRRERQRRIATAGVVGALVFAALTPAALSPATRDAAADLSFASLRCDHPRGTRFNLPACEGPMILHRPYAWR